MAGRLGAVLRELRRSVAAIRAYSSADAAPSPAPPPPTPSSVRSAAVPLATTDFSVAYTAAGLTPSTVVTALTAADRGWIRYLAELVESMLERDGHLAGTVRTRRLAVVGVPWEVLEPRTGASSAVTEACTAQLAAIPGFVDALTVLTGTVIHPLAALANIWDVSEGQARIVNLQKVPATRFAWNTQYTDAKVAGQLGELRLLTEAQPLYGEALAPYSWTISSDAALAAWPFRAGLGRLLVWQYLFKIYSVKDWATFAELCGMPYIWATIDPTAPDADRNALHDALASLGTEVTGIFSPGTDLKTVERNSHDGVIYRNFCLFMNSEMSKAVLGHTASSDAVPGELGGAQSSAQSVRQDLLEADARSIERSITDGILRPFVALNFPPGTAVPTFKLHVDLPENLESRATVDSKLVEMGVPLALSEIYSTYGRRAPAESEAIVAKQGDSGTVGARTSAVLSIAERVLTGQIPRETGIAIYSSIFGVDLAAAEEVIPDPASFTPTPQVDSSSQGDPS